MTAKLRQLASALQSRTMLVVISDLHNADAIAALKSVAQEHEVLVMHVQDPAERGTPGAVLYRGEEAETGRPFIGHGGRQNWDLSAEAQHQLTRHRIDYLLLPTDEKILAKVRFFLQMRGHRGGGGR